jgi:hypothetical protein
MPRRFFQLSVLAWAASSVCACSQDRAANEETTAASPLGVETTTAEPALPPPPPADPPPGHPPGPPPEALAACKDLAEGAACTVSLHDNAIDGTCRKGPHGEAALACVPANLPPPPPPGPPPGPPPEAFAACKDLAEGAACTVSLHDQSIDGTCRKGPHGETPLACVPANMPPPPPPGPPPGR